MKNYKIVYTESLQTENMTWHDLEDKVSIIMMNRKFLQTNGYPVYMGYMDLAMVYVVTHETSSEMIVYMLKKDDLDNLGIDKQQLHNAAVKNALAKRRFRIVPLLEHMDNGMFAPIAVRTPGAEVKAGAELFHKTVMDINPVTGEENILVCKLKNRPFGAAYMFLPSVLEEVHKRFNRQEFYIVPVSTHEVWFIKGSYVSQNNKRSYKDVEIDLLDLLEEYNDTQNASWRDILSYNLYYYLGNTNEEGQVIMPINNH
jgi:hypothetical protein